MRVKIGSNWFQPGPGQPVMVELSEADKRNITNMLPEASRYAEFHDDSPMTRAEREEWMHVGAHNAAGEALDKAAG